jgi:hypothetical protein
VQGVPGDCRRNDEVGMLFYNPREGESDPEFCYEILLWPRQAIQPVKSAVLPWYIASFGLVFSSKEAPVRIPYVA